MKINPINRLTAPYKTDKAVIFPKNKISSSQDEVTFSTKGLSFSKTLADVRDQVEMRSAEERVRIDEVARQVRDGSYSVRAEDIADKMIRSILFD